MASREMEHEEVISGLHDVYIGNAVVATIPATAQEGMWLEAQNVIVKITPPTISGMTCVGWIPYSVQTYRVQGPYVKYYAGEWIVSCYMVRSLTADVGISFRPIYIKS